MAVRFCKLATEGEMIDTPSVGDQAPRKLARSTLADVIELRIEELFLLVQAELRHVVAMTEMFWRPALF